MSQGRRPLVAGNWKMNGLAASAAELARMIAGAGDIARNADLLVCPPATLLMAFAAQARGSTVAVGAQDCHAEKAGAFTGDISAELLADAGATAVIVGHSERRQHYFETDTMVSRKAQAALASDLIVIMCVGETLAQRDQGNAERVVSGQLSGGLSGLKASDLARIIIAYEPVWAIGTGRTATPEQAQEMHAFIRRVFAEKYSNEVASAVRILYGGSVKPDNIAGLMKQTDIDGALVGGASLKADVFAQIVHYNR
jgi:triosephosphate isomerase